jgi:hypothetical protein
LSIARFCTNIIRDLNTHFTRKPDATATVTATGGSVTIAGLHRRVGTRSPSWLRSGNVRLVNLETVHSRKLAAVRREVAPGAVGSAWGPAIGKVWTFIRSQPGLWTDGHNIFLYHHPAQPGTPIVCDFGVEVTRTFETAGEVYATETPAGEAPSLSTAARTKA